jgi:hypothetical protein
MKRLTLHQAEIRQLRADARKLETVAKHLRERARDIAREEKLTQAGKNFFSKPSKIDPSLILTAEGLMEQEDEE